MSRVTGRTRPKKLNAKQNVQIFREDQVELIDYDAARLTIETGVEKNEESEYHLQQAIKASEAAKADAKIKDAYIPTPPTIASGVNYDLLYSKTYRHPATYIRSSSTVEDCSGSPYCMDEEDDIALKSINNKLPSDLEPCSEDRFEEVMSFLEEAAHNKQPYAAVDNAPVLPLAELEEQIDSTIPLYVKTYAKLIYDYWKSRRTETGNRALAPQLKFETGQDTDDADPYVCFRRRELRQIRKTRNRDAQSAEKLRKLRQELENARDILQLVRSREARKKDWLEVQVQVFEQRLAAKQIKRTLGIKGDDEDFINQKPTAKRQHLDPSQQVLAHQLRFPHVRGGPGDDLKTLEDHTSQRQEAVEKDVQNNVEKHVRWNEGYVDKTTAPLTPVSEVSFVDRSADYRQAMPATVSLPTPPASVSGEESNEVEMQDVDMKDDSRPPIPVLVRYASPSEVELGQHMPSFRRRKGRGGRMLFDRKLPFRQKDEPEPPPGRDRFRYDSPEDDVENGIPTEQELNLMQYRAHLFGRVRDSEVAQAQAVKRAQIEATEHNHPSSSQQQAAA